MKIEEDFWPSYPNLVLLLRSHFSWFVAAFATFFHLPYICCSNNKIGDAGAQALASSLPFLTTLKELVLLYDLLTHSPVQSTLPSYPEFHTDWLAFMASLANPLLTSNQLWQLKQSGWWWCCSSCSLRCKPGVPARPPPRVWPTFQALSPLKTEVDLRRGWEIAEKATPYAVSPAHEG